MGMSGCGKTAVGTAVAAALDVPFVDADVLRPPANVAKMAAGIPLDDTDRQPWLVLFGQALAQGSRDGGLVVACSALPAGYRDTIRVLAPTAFFAYLDADRATIHGRLTRRGGHFIPADLLDSQLATLEPLGATEDGVTLDATRTVGHLSWIIAAGFRPDRRRPGDPEPGG